MLYFQCARSYRKGQALLQSFFAKTKGICIEGVDNDDREADNCLALPCLALPCLALPCLAGRSFVTVFSTDILYKPIRKHEFVVFIGT